MSETIDARRLAEQLPELLDRALAGERFVIQREGQTVAELTPPPSPLSEAEREAAFVRSLEERGIVARREAGLIQWPSERTLIKIKGKPLSETIIEERDWSP